MGFKIDFVVKGGELICDHGSPSIYSKEIEVKGNSISDTVYIKQGDSVVGFTTRQYREFIEQAIKSSLFEHYHD